MDTVLDVRNLNVFYGKACALEGVSLSIPRGEICGLLGRNGAGKTTLLNALMGLLSISGGDYRLNGQTARGVPTHLLARSGLALVPADRQIYGELTVRENLALAAHSRRSGPWTPDRIFRLFPRLLERSEGLGENLSGREKQMLAIARSLLIQPSVLLLDEPTEGLAPIIVQEVIAAVAEVRREEGVSVLIVEQNLKAVAPILQTAHVLETGRVAWSGPAETLIEDESLSRSLLGL